MNIETKFENELKEHEFEYYKVNNTFYVCCEIDFTVKLLLKYIITPINKEYVKKGFVLGAFEYETLSKYNKWYEVNIFKKQD